MQKSCFAFGYAQEPSFRRDIEEQRYVTQKKFSIGGMGRGGEVNTIS